MRINNWMLQARSTSTAAGGVVPGSVGRDTSGRAFHIQYGFVDGKLGFFFFFLTGFVAAVMI